MARTYRFLIGRSEAGLRLDRFLVRHLPASVSRGMIQRAIQRGAVTVDEQPVKAHGKLRNGHVVTAQFDSLPAPPRDVPLTLQELPLDIVYEDEVLLVVNKPPGMVTHPAPGHWDSTLVNAILWHLRQAQGSRFKVQGECLQPSTLNLERPLARAGIIHRLDKDTSGLLLVAKTEAAHAALSKQMKVRAIRRRYVAVVEGRLPLDAGTVDAPIGRHLTHRKVMTVRHLGGRSAVTHYRVLKRATLERFSYSVLEVSLETGRTHQIRVHMAHLGHPVVGDATYGKRPTSFWQSLGINRHLLHACRLSFQHPVTRQPLSVSAPLPEDIAPWVGAWAASSF